MSNAQQNKSETQPNQSRDSQIDKIFDEMDLCNPGDELRARERAKAALQKIILEAKLDEVDDLRREFWRTTWTPYDPDPIFVERLKELKRKRND